jgi:aminoglycoside phosphotransferase (APT) family kinase protein
VNESESELGAALEAARLVVTRHVGGRVGSLAREPTGLSNLVFTVEHADGDLVVRLSADPTKGEVFRREHWAMVRARAAGVPSPEVLAIGEDFPFSYMLVRRVAGRTGLEHPERERVVREMGEYAALINSIATSSHGSTLECLSAPSV